MAAGINKYTVAESNNLQLGQNGFDVVAEHDSNTQSPDSGSWIALQCVGGVVPSGTAFALQFVRLVSAASNIGDDLGATFLEPGDIVYGNFSGVVNHTDSTAILLAYRG